MFRPGLYQAPRTTLRHYPLIAFTLTLAALVCGSFTFRAPAHQARHRLAAPAPYQPGRGRRVVTPLDDHRHKVQAILLARPTSYQVRDGDTLSTIARRVYGHASRWPALWWVNRHKISNPAALHVGMVLTLSDWHPKKAWLMRQAVAAIPKPSPAPAAARHSAGGGGGTSPEPSPPPATTPSGGIYSYSALEALWVSAGGPAAVEAQAAEIAECESGGNPRAYNPSGASGLWQILGNPFPGDPFDPATNARMAVAKYNAAGGFSPWVCQ